MTTSDTDTPSPSDAERDRRILQMRDAGSSWQEIAEAFDLTRQQARYGYQRAKREERRAARRGRGPQST